MRKLLILAIAAALLAIPGTAFAGVSGPAFYVDGELYRTVGTPTDFTNTGAPDHSFDTIYAIGEQDHNVATAAPGDPGFNGGRWKVQELVFTDYAAAVAAVDSNGSGDIDSLAEIDAAKDAGFATNGDILKSFECPVIPVPKGKS